MYKKIISGIFLLLLSVGSFTKAQQKLSPAATVSVLTCGPGKELFACFGHTALRIRDTVNGFDYVFNYGIFDFSTEYFYLKFARGKLNYMLGCQLYEHFIWEYEQEGRFVCQQLLDLNTAEKQKMFDFLLENYKPENRYYRYDFFQDNCATRIRDLIANSLIDRKWHQGKNTDNHFSFREKFHQYTQNYPWWVLGIDIVLGLPSDKTASDWDYMYLPIDLMNQLDTTIIRANSRTLVNSHTLTLKEQYSQSAPPIIPPLLIFGIFFTGVALLSSVEKKKGCYCKAFDVTLFIIIFIVSIPVSFFCFFSDHNATQFNLDLLWINPFILIPLIKLRKTPPYILYCLLFCLTIALIYHFIYLTVMGIIPILLILTIGIRLMLLLLHRQNIETKKGGL